MDDLEVRTMHVFISRALQKVLKYFWKFDIDITSIESRPTKHDGAFEFFVDFQVSCCCCL